MMTIIIWPKINPVKGWRHKSEITSDQVYTNHAKWFLAPVANFWTVIRIRPSLLIISSSRNVVNWYLITPHYKFVKEKSTALVINPELNFRLGLFLETMPYSTNKRRKYKSTGRCSRVGNISVFAVLLLRQNRQLNRLHCFIRMPW